MGLTCIASDTSDMERLTEKRGRCTLIRTSTQNSQYGRPCPSRAKSSVIVEQSKGVRYATFPYPSKLYVRRVERIDAQPHNRLEALRPVVEKLGGRIVNGFFAYGEYDVVLILEMPDEASAAALAVAAAGGGRCGPSRLRNSSLPPKE